MLTEGRVEVDGVPVRYVEAGHGAPLVHVQPADDASPSPAHDVLAREFRVIALQPPGGGPTLERIIAGLGLADFTLMATGDASAAAIRLALAEPERVRALVLEAPTAIRRDAGLEGRLAELTTPTLVLFGTADRADAQATGHVYTGRIPNGHLVFVYDAAHAIARDRPEAFAEVVADFLERHEAFIISRTPTVIHP